MRKGPPKDITAELGALIDRLHTACLTESRMRSDGPQGLPSRWSAARLEWAKKHWEWMDHGNEASMLSDADIARRMVAPPDFYPTPQQVDDWLPTMDLLRGVRWTARYVLRLRAHQLWYGWHAAADEAYAHWRGGWRAIGEMAGVSHERARQAHWEAVVSAYEAMMRRAA